MVHLQLHAASKQAQGFQKNARADLPGACRWIRLLLEMQGAFRERAELL